MPRKRGSVLGCFFGKHVPTVSGRPALRLLADHMHGDAAPEERRHLTAALRSADIFVRLAGIEASARSGDIEMVERAIQRAIDEGREGIETVAEGLAASSLPLDAALADHVFDILRDSHLEMRHDASPTRAVTTAYLIRGLKRCAPQEWRRLKEARQAVLDILRDRPDSRPITVTSLEFLVATLPDHGLPESQRWHRDDVELVVDASRRHGEDMLPRAVKVVGRVARPGDAELSDWYEHALDVFDSNAELETLAEAIRETRPARAEALLEELMGLDIPSVKKAAEAALRRIENRDTSIDVSFSPSDGTAQDSPD